MVSAILILVFVVSGLLVARFVREVRSDAAYLEAHRAKKSEQLVKKINIRAQIARKNVSKEWTGADL